MRQGQQNRRGRGRGNNNHNNNNGGGRKGQNPLTRSFESNGPEMKIRGTPAHVAEKYMSLARDALASSDPVLAENYLQHAEHYNRIILTYREQQLAQQSGDGANGSQNQRNRHNGNGASAANERADQGAKGAEAQGAAAADQPDTPQPVVRSDDEPKRERPARAPRASRQDGSKPSRSRGGQRSSASRSSASQSEEPRAADSTSDRQPESRRQRDRFGDADEQPQFLRRPVRRSRTSEADKAQSASTNTDSEAVAAQPVADDAQE